MPFQSHELRRQPNAGDWTLARGVRTGVQLLVIRSTIGLIVLSALLVGMDQGLAFIVAHVKGFGGLLLLLCVPIILLVVGFAFGRQLCKELNDRFGLDGVVPAALGIVFGLGTIIAATILADLILPYQHLSIGITIILAGGMAMISIVRDTLLADY